MVELILARHGESQSNVENRFNGHDATPLTAEGRRQAARLAAMIVGEVKPTAIYSSDLVRASETAAVVAEATGLTTHTTTALRERSAGELTGLTYADAQLRYAAVFDALVVRRDPEARAPGGENASDVRARVVPLLDQFTALTGGRVLLISHAFTLNVMLRTLLSIAPEVTTIGFFTDHCAVHRLELHPGRPVLVRALNDARHLGHASDAR
ncbi:MAG: Phosphoglycerate mutase [Myxococcales bacterium]|nr:Phosphoglycerate mutase [Myxococcales bacterium]